MPGEIREVELNIRNANPSDLQAITRTWLTADGEDAQAELAIPAVLPHLLQTGVVRVAETNEGVSGFATSFERSTVRFLAQMFVLPGQQSSGTGRALLQSVMPDDGSVLATIASPDPRAVSLYIRRGMQPCWPLFDLAVAVSDLRAVPNSMLSLTAADPDDPQLVEWDTLANGRHRPQDQRYFVERRGGWPFWLERDGHRVGYGYLQVQRASGDASWGSGHVRIGPLAVRDRRYAFDSVLAATQHARDLGTHLSALMPGPHPALGALLNAGFRIRDIETFLTSARPPFVDGELYVPSGGGLF